MSIETEHIILKISSLGRTVDYDYIMKKGMLGPDKLDMELGRNIPLEVSNGQKH